MQKRYALRNIAIGLVLTHKDRCSRVAMMNSLIDEKAAAYRSPANVDGMPAAQGTGDPVATSVVNAERVTAKRDAEQVRVDAVEWALEYVCGFQREEDAPYIRTALLSYFEDKDYALMLIDSNTNISPQGFVMMRRSFIQQILKYLSLA